MQKCKCVLRQSFCGKFKLSAGSGSQGSQLLECMYECDFSSVRTGDLKMHMMAHREQKAHKCNICDYSSSQVSNLRSHIYIFILLALRISDLDNFSSFKRTAQYKSPKLMITVAPAGCQTNRGTN